MERASQGAGGAATAVPWAAQLLCWRLVGNALHRGCMRSTLPLLPRILALAAEHAGAPGAPKLIGDVATALLNVSSAWWALTSGASEAVDAAALGALALDAEGARALARALRALLSAPALAEGPAAARTRIVQAIGTLALARAADGALLGPLIKAEVEGALAPLAAPGAPDAEVAGEALAALSPVARAVVSGPSSASWVA